MNFEGNWTDNEGLTVTLPFSLMFHQHLINIKKCKHSSYFLKNYKAFQDLYNLVSTDSINPYKEVLVVASLNASNLLQQGSVV